MREIEIGKIPVNKNLKSKAAKKSKKSGTWGGYVPSGSSSVKPVKMPKYKSNSKAKPVKMPTPKIKSKYPNAKPI